MSKDTELVEHRRPQKPGRFARNDITNEANGPEEADLPANSWIANARLAVEGPKKTESEKSGLTNADLEDGNATPTSPQQSINIDCLCIFMYLLGDPSFITTTNDESQAPSVLKCYCFECDCCSGHLGNCYEMCPQACMLSFAYICCCPATVGFSKLCRFRDKGGCNQCHAWHYWCCEERYEEVEYEFPEGEAGDGGMLKEYQKRVDWITTGDFKRRREQPMQE